MTRAIYLGEAEKLGEREPPDEAAAAALAEKLARQQLAAASIRRFVLMELFGGRDQLNRAPADEAERMWLVYQARMEAEAEANRRAAEKH